MKPTRRSLILLLVLTSGCLSGTAPDAQLLHGEWITDVVGLSPSGSMQYHLALRPDGHFSLEIRSYGVYAGQAPAVLSAFSRHEGQFDVDGARLRFRPEKFIGWDSFQGVAEPTVQSPSPYSRLFDDATFRVRRDRLVLHYLTYPADAPVPTQMRFRRSGS
jgi:hypothetical protein